MPIREFITASPALETAIDLLIAPAIAVLVHAAAIAVLRRVLRGRGSLQILLRATRAPSRWTIAFLALALSIEVAPPPAPLGATLLHWADIGLIACATWLVASAIDAFTAIVIALHPSDVADNLQARALATRARVLGRTVKGLAIFVGACAVLMTFPDVRQLGTTLLASAGVAGLVAGLAARTVLGNVMAGLQIAFTQPIRIDDVLIVDGEWGRVEEITSAFAVLKIWDERRLVIPLHWFIENPFQNWTKTSSQII
ncbi:MAG TPA: mechanosensitive ion channel domain-containing protein [Usitatibacter sp.]|nr:mechanosensitive ion channel domain-containing protein [Usitatibacter sp.]